jgi:ferrochelatase
VPQPIRYFLAKFISSKRTPIAKHIYEQMGGKSPILEQTQAQATALQTILMNENSHIEYKTFINMRYWSPMTNEVVQQVKNYDPDHIILLPLYPQYSTTTTYSSVEEWKKYAQKYALKQPSTLICCYAEQDLFIEAHCALLHNELVKYEQENNDFIVLFSAHGLPEKVINAGDPYQYQVEKSVEKIVEKYHNLHGKKFNYRVCYQSRVGPLKWIEPNTEDLILQYSEQNKGLVVVPIAFVSEHSETLVELDIEYRGLAMSKGANYYERVPALQTHPLYIKALAQSVQKAVDNYNIISAEFSCLHYEKCPSKFIKCPIS